MSMLRAVGVFAPPGPDLRDVRTTAGDYNEADLFDACDRKEIVGNIIDTWLAKDDALDDLAPAGWFDYGIVNCRD
jgi:hypothetical protein